MGKKADFGNAGPDVVFDAVATETTLDDALHLVRSNEKIVIIGQIVGPGYTVTKKVDWSIQTYKGIDIIGALRAPRAEQRSLSRSRYSSVQDR